MDVDRLRNVALIGHSGEGKTTLAEAILFNCNAIDRQGKVEDGNTVSDYDKMEIEKGFSINTSVVPIIWKDNKINFIDTPGYFDFVEEVNAAMRASEAAVILVDAGAGVQIGTEHAWNACERYKMPRFIVINKRDKDEFDFYKTFGELKERFGEKLIPFSWPLSVEIDEELKEAIASADDELMEKYLMEESVLNVGVFDEDSRFKSNGGFAKINKVFANKLESIVLELNEYLYDDGGRTA